MNDEDRSKFAERWVDSALDRYNEAEPRPGYETRLLATIADARTRRPRWRTMWAWGALAVAAAVIIAAIALNVGHSSRPRVPDVAKVTPPQSPTSTQQQPSTLPPPSEKSVTVARKRPAHHHEPANSFQVVAAVASHSAPPKQPQFPTPAPLSEQERLMLAYVRNTPTQEIETVIAQQEAFQRLVDSLGVPEEQEKDER